MYVIEIYVNETGLYFSKPVDRDQASEKGRRSADLQDKGNTGE